MIVYPKSNKKEDKAENDKEKEKNLIEKKKEQQEIVQKFINDINALMEEEEVKQIGHYEELIGNAQTFARVRMDKDKYEEATEKEGYMSYECFYWAYLYYLPTQKLEYSDEEKKEKSINENLKIYTAINEDDETEVGTEFINIIKEVWEYQINEAKATGTMPDLYEVYLEMQGKSEDSVSEEISEEGLPESSSAEEISEAEESSIVESSEAEESSAVIEDSIESASSPESSQSISSAAEKASNNEGVARNVAPEKSFGEKMKDNIVAIILGACLIAAIGIIIAMSRKNKKN